MVRFDKKQCKNKVLEAIEDGRLRVDIGDQSDKSYYVESMTYERQGGTKQALMLQFRRKKQSSEPDLINTRHGEKIRIISVLAIKASFLGQYE